MMNLRTYLTTTGTRQAELAALVGIKPSHMSLIVKQLRSPSLAVAAKIEAATGGKVKAASLLTPRDGGAS